MAQRLRFALRHGVTMIASTPETWPRYLYGTRRYVIDEFPFSLVYRLKQDQLQLIALAHAKREPGYWRGRVEDGDD